jgi:PEP-CTERM motif
MAAAMKLSAVAVLSLFAVSFASPAAQAASFSLNPTADAFVTTGPTGNLSGNNYGGGGGISVAAAGLPQGELQSVLKFDLSGAAASFDGVFGAGQWNLVSVTLQLTATPANNAIFNTPAAGQLAISWLQNDAWTEGTGTPGSPGASGITYTTLQSTFIGGGDESLGTFAFSGATSGAFNYALGLTTGLSADVLAGSILSLRMLAADSAVSGVFNSRSFGTVTSRPLLTIVAVPEPSSLVLCTIGLALLCTRRRAR